jgi:hypothetical protein
MKTNYDALIPKAILFNLRQIEDMGLIKVDMAKKLIAKNELEFVKIGNKIHISRDVLIKFIESNTIEAAS